MEFERVNNVDTEVAFENLFDKLDYRNYDIAGYVLKELGIKKIKMMTNNPDKINAIVKQGINVLGDMKLDYNITPKIQKYLNVKKNKFNHNIQI
jgi:GTP cyclohydrolase II